MDAAREVAATCDKDYEAARLSRAELSAKAAGAGEETGRVEARLAAARETISDTALEEAVEATLEDVKAAEERLRVAEAALVDASPELLQMELTNARDRLERADRDTTRATTRLTELGALLDDRASLGIYDQLANAKAEHETLRSRLERIRRQAEAVRLLRETMHRHRQEAQQSYVAPFRERIERLGRLVFGPDFAVEISTELVIVNRTLNGITVPFESLSSGAKEQLSLLGRLACAQLIDQEQGAPVILDDALGFADEQRLNALGVVLNDVGKSAQVIILTCQAERYASLGSAETIRLAA